VEAHPSSPGDGTGCLRIGTAQNLLGARMSARRWISRYAPRTIRVPSGTFSRRRKYRSHGAGSIGSTHMKARIPRSAQLAKIRERFPLMKTSSYVNTGSKWRQVGRRRWHCIPSEFGGYVCRRLETEAMESRRDQDHYGRGACVDSTSLRRTPLNLMTATPQPKGNLAERRGQHQ